MTSKSSSRRSCDEEAMENIARYIIRASFSQERMTYLPDGSKVLYRSKDGKNEETFGINQKAAGISQGLTVAMISWSAHMQK